MFNSVRKPRKLFNTFLLLGLFWPNLVAGEETLDADRLEPAPAGDPFVGVDGTKVEPLALSVGLLASYAKDPLVATAGDREAAVIADQFVLHGLVALSFAERVKLHLNLPTTLLQSGDSPSFGGLTLSSPEEVTSGDLRVGGRVVLNQQQGAVPAIALSLEVWAPTGNESEYTSSGEARLGMGLAAGAQLGDWLWGANLGRRSLSERPLPGITWNSQYLGRVGIARRFSAFQLGVELLGSTVAGAQTRAFSNTGSNLESWLVGRVITRGFWGTLAGGPGLTRGLGTPTYRIVFGLGGTLDLGGKSHGSGSESSTGSGTTTTHDQTTGTGGNSGSASADSAGSPTTKDTDGDGVADSEDVCPTVSGKMAPPRPGCPPDGDSDGVIDAEDACPKVAGTLSPDPKKSGCPEDRDGDGVIDAEDACADERGKRSEDPKKNGCPESVRVVGKQIVILQKINFATGKDEIQNDSYGVLRDVAAVLQQHPDIVRVAVDGHTDNVGREENNMALSRRRAISVVRWLVKEGVDERRLEARGFGPRRPIVKETSPAARAKNRRVEFQILKRSERGKASWTDGEVQ